MLRASNPGMTPTGEEVVDLVRQLIGSKKSAKANQEDLRDRLLDVLIEVRFGTISRAKTEICTKEFVFGDHSIVTLQFLRFSDK